MPLHFRQQPALFECGFLLAESQRAVQQQRFGFAHFPHRRCHAVPAQSLKRRDALIAIDHYIAFAAVVGSHHHDRRLLAGFGE
jgi:hypothetical protein